MATINNALSPVGKISMIGIWIETVLYGVNCVMYGLCMLVVLRKGKVLTLRWALLVMSTTLFLLCTVHIGASLQQLLDAFVYGPVDVPDYSTTYWLDYTTKLRLFKNNLYYTLVFVQDFVLIWRLYVVFMYDWRVIVLPIIFEAASIGTAYSASAVSARPNAGLYNSVVTDLVISACAIDIALNVFVTVAIAGRLWWIGWTMASLTSTQTNQYASSAYVVVESGAIFATTIIAVFVLYALYSPAALTALDVASQLAALTPLLIVVQVGLTDRYHVPTYDFSKTVPVAQDEIIFQAGVPRERDSHRDSALGATLSRSSDFVHDAHV